MGRNGYVMKSVATFALMSLTLGSAANAAATTVKGIDPLVTVSLFGTAESRAAVCAAGSQAAAAGGAVLSAQANAPASGCVLPVVDAPPPPAGAEAVPAAAAPSLAPNAGIGVLPLLLGLAAMAGAVALILSADEEAHINLPIPESP